MKEALKFYINSSLHVALAVVTFTIITKWNFHIPLNYPLLVFIFFGTITGYNFIKYAGIAKFHHLSLTSGLGLIQKFSFVCFAGLITTVFYQSSQVLLIAGVLGICTLLYALPLSGNRSLRGIPGLKIYVIAFVVAGVTVILPLLENESFPSHDHIIDFIQRCIIAIVLILPFEIRDLKRDKIQLETIPQKLGVYQTKQLGYILTLIFCSMELLKIERYLTYTISLVFLGIMCVFFLKKSTVDQEPYFASFWVEAAPMLWLGVFYLLRTII